MRCQITELDGWVELVWVVISKSDESTSSMNIEREIWMLALIEWRCIISSSKLLHVSRWFRYSTQETIEKGELQLLLTLKSLIHILSAACVTMIMMFC